MTPLLVDGGALTVGITVPVDDVGVVGGEKTLAGDVQIVVV